MYIYKAIYLPFPEYWLAVTLLIIIVSIIVQYIRISLGWRANKTEASMEMLVMILVSLLTILYLIYFIVLQPYVLLLETIICIIAFVLVGIELMMGLVMFIKFKSLEKEA